MGHSFFSLMNYNGNYVIERFYEIAKKSGKNKIRIDFLTQKITPSDFRVEGILNSLKSYREYFPKQLESQYCSIEHVKEVIILLTFDLSKRIFDKNIKELELAVYKCEVHITDDREKMHIAEIPEWWKY